MFIFRRIPYPEVFSNLFSRTSVTVSWPIRRGRDFFKWEKCTGAVLDEIKEEMQQYEKSTIYRSEHNFKVEQTKSGVAKLMGVDPQQFSNDEFKLSLLYLFPSDIEKRFYKPFIPETLPVKTILDIIAQYNNSGNPTDDISLENQDIREGIRLVHNVILDALKHAESLPGLELYIDRDEVISLPQSTTKEDNVLKENMSNDSRPLELFPFIPKPTKSKDADTVLSLQFLKLNDLIQDRPDLIRMYYPVVRQMIVDHELKPDLTERTPTNFELEVNPLFRAKASNIFLFNSVETTMIPGSGKIVINGESYLDLFPHMLSRIIIISPLRLTQTLGVFDIDVKIDQEDPSFFNGLAHCISMSISACLQQFDPTLKKILAPVHRKPFRVEYKKAGKKNSRARYKWRKR